MSYNSSAGGLGNTGLSRKFTVPWGPLLLLGCLVSSIIFYSASRYYPPTPEACLNILYPNVMGKPAIAYHWMNSVEYFAQGTIFRGPPTLSREAAWDSLGPYGAIELDTPPTSWSQSSTKYMKTQTDEIIAIPGFSLHMNCLKIFRQYIYKDDSESIYVPPSREVVDQCIEKLRQDLMCNFETTPFLEVNTGRTASGVAPNVHTTHFCRDYDQIVEWAVENFLADRRAPGDFIPLLV